MREAIELVRYRTGRGSKSRVYEWLPKAWVSAEPKPFYTQREVACLIWFAQLLNRTRSTDVASSLLRQYIERLDEETFISQAFGG